MKDRSVDAACSGENPPAVPGYLSEIFCSLQGEGIHVGVTQIFMRLAGCSFCCGYCDTRESAVRPDEYVVYGMGDMAGPEDLTGLAVEADGTAANAEDKTTFPNPVIASDLSIYLEKVISSIPGIHSLSVTGGEPLEQPEFLESFLPLFRRLDIPVYLETNGLHETAASKIEPFVDIVSMDIKLPSLCLPDAGISGSDIFEIYSRVIPIFARKDLFVKVVIDDGLDPGEFEHAVDLVAGTDRSIPFVIQPVTPPRTIDCRPPTSERLMYARAIAAAKLEDVRVIPQCHKLLGIR